jgi:tRNA threonylcarbamoyladenosine biosynthesis protein TsaE
LDRWDLVTTSPEQTRKLGRLLGEILSTSTLLFLMGDLGAGKTCFVQGLARGLQVPDEEPVTSPTFTLMNQYAGRIPLYHFDLYRLDGLDDLLDLGFDEYLHGDGISVVEWADRAVGLADEALYLHFSQIDEESRRISFAPRGEFYRSLLSQLADLWQERGMG